MPIQRIIVLFIIFLGFCGLIIIWQTDYGGADRDEVMLHSFSRESVEMDSDGKHIPRPLESTKTLVETRQSLGKSNILHGNMQPNRVNATHRIHQVQLKGEEKDFYDIVEEQLRRKTHLDEACTRLGISRDFPAVSWENTVHFIVSDRFKLIFCFVPKISCTTWKDVMSTLYQTDPHPLFKVPHRARGKTLKRKGIFLKMSDIKDSNRVLQRWNTYDMVMFTRDPLERALSAYLDKFVYGETIWEKQFGGEIIKRYREQKASKLTFPLKEKIQFHEFIRFITDNGSGSKMTQQTDHWLPVSRITAPCQFTYSFIGHYETLKYDAPYVINKFNLSAYVTFPEVHDSRSRDRLIKAYREVPPDLIHRLIDYYKTDYELFGYSANTTLDIIFGRRV